MSKSNTEVILNQANFLIVNINKHLKKTNLNTIADFIYLENNRVIITTCQAIFAWDMSIIEKYVKEIIDSKNIDTSWLSKLKLYLKILGLSYILENTNLLITSELVKEVIKEIHLFNDVILTSKSCIIKTSFKSNLAIVWVDI